MDTGGWIFMGVIFALMIVPGVFLINGKGAFLIAGYNTMSPEKKAKYDEKTLCKFTGWLIILYTVGLALGAAMLILQIMWLGIGVMILIHVALIGAIVYFNVGNRLKKRSDDGSSEEVSPKVREKASRTKKVIIAIAVSISAISLLAVGIMFYLGEREPIVTVTGVGIEIDAMYGVSIAFADITEISLIENSMNDIGIGRRTDGYGGLGTRLKGNFQSDSLGRTLLFVHTTSSPTIHISRENTSDVYLSFGNSESTRTKFYEIMEAYGSR